MMIISYQDATSGGRELETNESQTGFGFVFTDSVPIPR